MKKVIILGFGGTIAMVPDAHGVLKPAKTVEEILALVPMLKEKADVSFRGLENRDSTNITPAHWGKLAEAIAEIHNDYDGVIVTHGTDTMAYTASAVSLALGRGLKIPVVFTGAQLPLISFGTDARFNLETAMKAVLQASAEKVAEVMIVFSDRVLRANRAIKISESKFPAFDSPALPPLAIVTALGLNFESHVLKADPGLTLNLKTGFQRGILTVDLVPGLEPILIEEVLKSGQCKGLLLKSLGAGNVPSEEEYSLLPLIEKAIHSYKVPVLVSTKFVGGKTHMDIYEPGKLALDAGAIPTGDLTDVTAQVKFMWALARGYTDLTGLKDFMNTSIVGEITA